MSLHYIEVLTLAFESEAFTALFFLRPSAQTLSLNLVVQINSIPGKDIFIFQICSQDVDTPAAPIFAAIVRARFLPEAPTAVLV